MTFTVAFLILAIGIAIGYRLPGPVARIKELYRRRTRKPILLRPVSLEQRPAEQSPADRS